MLILSPKVILSFQKKTLRIEATQLKTSMSLLLTKSSGVERYLRKVFIVSIKISTYTTILTNLKKAFRFQATNLHTGNF